MGVWELPDSVRAALGELKAVVSRTYGCRLAGVYIYGSYARGDFTADSDVDVLIALQGDVRPTGEMDRISRDISDICLRYDLLIATFPVPASWLREGRDPFFANIRREAVEV